MGRTDVLDFGSYELGFNPRAVCHVLCHRLDKSLDSSKIHALHCSKILSDSSTGALVQAGSRARDKLDASSLASREVLASMHDHEVWCQI